MLEQQLRMRGSGEADRLCGAEKHRLTTKRTPISISASSRVPWPRCGPERACGRPPAGPLSARRGGNLNANSRRSAIFIEYTVEFSHYLCLQSHCREIEPTCRTMLWERLKCDRRFAESPSACAISRHMTNSKDFVAIHFPIQRETQIRPAISSSLTNFPWYCIVIHEISD